MSGFDFGLRGRPGCCALDGLEMRLDRVEVNARLEEEEISLWVFLGLRIPYKPESDDILNDEGGEVSKAGSRT
jgi:hypothetical protein